MTKTAVPQPLKWHGGKGYLAKKIIGLMPPRIKNSNAPALDADGWLHYVEPYFGGGAVLLEQDPEGISEVVNDINRNLVGFWRALQSTDTFNAIKRTLDLVPFAADEYQDAFLRGATDWGQWPIQACVGFFIHCRQSLAGRMKGFAPLTRNRTRRGMNEQVSAWMNAIEGLPSVHERLRRVVILNMDALDCIKQQDGSRTLFYLDPPYLKETRAAKEVYAHEMSESQHASLLNILGEVKGRFLLSGYPSSLYEAARLRYGWNRHDFEIDNKAASGEEKRKMIECVWTNF
jgi:DNA adenine methylase